MKQQRSVKILTNENTEGLFGEFGGSYVPEPLQNVLDVLAENFEKYKNDDDFNQDFKYYLNEFVGRPSPLTFAKILTDKFGGAKIYLKRETNIKIQYM